LRASGVRNGALLAATGGTLALTGSEFSTADGGVDFSCIDVRDIRGALFRGVRVTPGSGQRTRGIRAVRSQVTIANSSLTSGSGVIEALALDMQGSDCSLENCDIAASPSAHSPTAISASDSTLLVARSRVSVSGGASAVGINAHGGSLVLSRNTMRGNDTPEYVSLVKVEDCDALIANNILLGSDAGESVCIMTRGGPVTIVSNTVIAGSGRTMTAGILVQGDPFPSILDNILARGGADRGGAIVQMGGRVPFAPRTGAGPIIRRNDFAGWERLLRIDYAAGEPLDIKRTDDLNRIDGDPDEGPVQGNIAESLSLTFRGSGG
jgi:hypothetical protein